MQKEADGDRVSDYLKRITLSDKKNSEQIAALTRDIYLNKIFVRDMQKKIRQTQKKIDDLILESMPELKEAIL